MTGAGQTDIDPCDEPAEHAAHLERSRTKWDRWSDWYRLSEQDLEPIRAAAVDDLDLARGDRVLEVGCGPGVNFALVRDEIGQDGRLEAIDYSPRMVEKARARIDAHGWANVVVVEGDATTADLGGPSDAAIATLSLSVMPDVRRTVENIHGALRPGGRLAVVDARPIPAGPGRVLNPVIRAFLRWYANWNPNGDVLEAVDEVFDEMTLQQTAVGGTVYRVVASKRNDAA